MGLFSLRLRCFVGPYRFCLLCSSVSYVLIVGSTSVMGDRRVAAHGAVGGPSSWSINSLDFFLVDRKVQFVFDRRIGVIVESP